MSKILFLTTAHRYDDDRIFYHQAKTLKSEGNQVKICSLSSEFQGDLEGIEIESYSILEKSTEEKTKVFERVCDTFQPDCIICSEPLAVIASKKFKKEKKISVIYDITEWYPSMRMVENFSFPLNIIHAVKFFLVQLYAGFISTHYIFGENTKKFPLAYFFPFKKSIVLPYYPDDIYIHQHIKKLEQNKITLCYTGQFSEEKGIGNFFAAINTLKNKKPDLEISILLMGGTRKEKDEKYFSELISKYQFENITIKKSASFESFTEAYADADICFDLRTLNYENHHCLPIKIFYYAASGKPVIYTDLKATRQQVNVSEFGFLVDPTNSDEIADIILTYIENPELYFKHAHNARSEYEKNYNWNVIKNSFINFIKKSIK
ncbi:MULTISPECIES: glycosyltransferase [Chryseobacterium]|uniref:Glycosyltransferase involved in cell wall biosynthesis n=1 Tax=Chryseobacterium geocarposphaerae TaxID=1416776 RepID=A0ABU1LHN4_9FLAO|nr:MULTISPECIES: glycosyltransferase [Chryseobacterium]MDR6406224.1 glycosyltransferase involved in cell wall biosynthesis [Chryseobacterium geocarposphaerae]MDR6699756.1 glycosyltransferase involved in cell wall biosynthesis [Chryseobacterium ginsenosidimutans]